MHEMKTGNVRACFGALLVAGLTACSSGDFALSDPNAVADATDTSPIADGPGDASESDDGTGGDGGIDSGGCAVDCQGGACVAGVCRPVALATGLDGPYGIALNGKSIYVTEFVAHGRVLRFDKHGSAGQTPQVVADEPTLAVLTKSPTYVTQPFSIAANETDVFWSDVGGLADTGFTKLFRVPTTPAGKVVPYYELCAQGGVAVNDLRVFWANQATPKCLRPEQNGLFRGDLAPTGGHSGSVYFPFDTVTGAPTTPGPVVIDGNRVFVGVGSQLLIFDADKIDVPSGVTDALVGGSDKLVAAPYAIATDFESVIWTGFPSGGSVSSLAKSSAPNTAPRVLVKDQTGALGVTVDGPGSYVYFTNYAKGQLLRVKKDGSSPAEIILAKLDHPAFLASDLNTLYFTTFGSGHGDGALMRLAKP